MLEKITAISILFSSIAAAAGVFVAYKVHENQKLLLQRQLILPLWDHMASLSIFDPQKPIGPNAIKIVNTLELVALCCEGKMVDENVIRRTFKEQFIMHYESIDLCVKIPGRGITGKKLLEENKAAIQFYSRLKEEALSTDKLRN